MEAIDRGHWAKGAESRQPSPAIVTRSRSSMAESIWGTVMQKFFFDMKDGVPFRDRIGIDFSGNLEAIAHCKELAQHFRDDSLRDDQDLEISVVNALGREIHREFVHRA
jgi:hypothetical protein